MFYRLLFLLSNIVICLKDSVMTRYDQFRWNFIFTKLSWIWLKVIPPAHINKSFVHLRCPAQLVVTHLSSQAKPVLLTVNNAGTRALGCSLVTFLLCTHVHPSVSADRGTSVRCSTPSVTWSTTSSNGVPRSCPAPSHRTSSRSSNRESPPR